MRRLVRPFRVLALALAVAAPLALAGCPPQPAPSQDAAPGADAANGAAVAPAASFTVPIVPWDERTRIEAIAAGAAVIEKHQCGRCHTIDALPAPARPLHCTGCHLYLKALAPGQAEWDRLTTKYGAPIIQRYQTNIRHLVRVPDLTNLGKRVRADWLVSYLRAPYDLRPMLGESMVRHALDDLEIAKVARYVAAVARAPAPGTSTLALPPPPDAARLQRGKELFQARACATCHTFGNLALGVSAATLESAKPGSALAPNLRHVRDRTRLDVLVGWLRDPKSVSPTTLMPNLSLTQDEAEVLRDWLLYADPELAPSPTVAELAPPKLLERPVSYEEMKEKVLGRVCVHCHMNDYEKDPGPGNRGGLGYRGIQLQMRTYEALVAGAVERLEAPDAKGVTGVTENRYSVLVARPGEANAPIVEAMLRRKREAPRDQIAAFDDHVIPPFPPAEGGKALGMPLGLPAMSDEEISILATWIAQGCPGPVAVTGVAGINDGYLVPDGPIAKNKGCELRAPDKQRPAWAVATEAKPAPPASAAPAAPAAPSAPSAPSAKAPAAASK